MDKKQLALKAKFKRDVRKVDVKAEDYILESFTACIESLPNSYAKGYLVAKLDAHNWEDYEEVMEDLLLWADYDIWK